MNEKEIYRILEKSLHIRKTSVENITVLKKGMTNYSFLISCRDQKYILRIPGEGTKELISRQQEYDVYKQVQSLKICDHIFYLDAHTGYKITLFYENASVCDPENVAEVAQCMHTLRNFHDVSLKVAHTFDIKGQIELYESLRGGAPSYFADYEDTKKKVYEVLEFLDEQPKQWTLTHMDANPDNFLFIPAANGTKQVRLIDWEYAGMQDCCADIAMFALYAMYDRANTDMLINLYYPEGCTFDIRLKIYCYMAAGGLLWSNWCEYKHLYGIEFGEYARRQYAYAKEYYKIFLEES